MEELLVAAPTFTTQFLLWVIHTVVWYVICTHIAYPLIVKYIKTIERKERYIRLFNEAMKNNFGADIGEGDEAIDMISRTNSCIFAHAIGGLMLFSSAFSITSIFNPRINFALARHGNLCELGMETQDVLKRLYEIWFCGELERKKNPFGLMVAIFIHHIVSFCMMLPFNLYYPKNRDVHEVSCLLQLAAFIAISLQQYGYILDVTHAKELLQMKITVSLSFVIIVWSRIMRYFPLLWNLIMTFSQDENWLLLLVSGVPIICMTYFNMAMVLDATKKLCKYLPLTVTYDKENNFIDHGIDTASAGLSRKKDE